MIKFATENTFINLIFGPFFVIIPLHNIAQLVAPVPPVCVAVIFVG
jgi:hypothetical protein